MQIKIPKRKGMYPRGIRFQFLSITEMAQFSVNALGEGGLRSRLPTALEPAFIGPAQGVVGTV